MLENLFFPASAEYCCYCYQWKKQTCTQYLNVVMEFVMVMVLIAQVVCLKYIRDSPILNIKKIKCNTYNYIFTHNHMYPVMLYLKHVAKET